MIREDPNRRGLLYAGTETGLYVSFDDGANWQPFQGNLPVCPIHDVIVKGTDLVAATHGRSFWILDDLSPLHQMQDDIAGETAHLYQPRPAKRFRTYGRFGEPSLPYKSYGRAGGMVVTNYQKQEETGEIDMQFVDAGKNPPDGVIVHYWLKDAPKDKVTLTFRDKQGNQVRRFESEPVETEQAEGDVTTGEGYEAEDTAEDAPTESLKVSTKPGANRFVWNMRYANATDIDKETTPDTAAPVQPDILLGPVAVPGTYSVELAVDGQKLTQEFKIEADPRVAGSAKDLQAQLDLLLQIRDKVSQSHATINRLRAIRTQAEDWGKRSDSQDVKAASRALAGKLSEIEEFLTQPKSNDPRQFPNGLADKLAVLAPMIANADVRPPKQYYQVFEKLSGEIDEQIARLQEIVDRDVKEFNETVKNAGPIGIAV